MRRTLPIYLPGAPDPHWVGECLTCGARTAPDPIRRRQGDLDVSEPLVLVGSDRTANLVRTPRRPHPPALVPGGIP